MKYLDANVFIYMALSDRSEAKFISARKILESIVGGTTPGATSTLTWDELVWAIRKIGGIEVARDEGRKFLSLPRLRLLAVDERILHAAQHIADTYGLKPRDAIHAACCIENGIEELITDDSDFDHIDGLKRIPLENAAKSL